MITLTRPLNGYNESGVDTVDTVNVEALGDFI